MKIFLLIFYFCSIWSSLGHSMELPILRIGTYNLKGLQNLNGLREDLKALSQVDVWAFQEVISDEDGAIETLKTIIPSQYTHIISHAIAVIGQNGSSGKKIWEGSAIVSRYPIIRSISLPLRHTTPKNREALVAWIQVDEHVVMVVNTDHEVDFVKVGFRDRRKQLESLSEHIEGLRIAGPIVVLGDFNTTDSIVNRLSGISGRDEVAMTYAWMREHGWTVTNSAAASDHTFESFGIREQLDHIFFRGFAPNRPGPVWHRFDDRRGSDHFPIFADLKM